MTFSTSKTFHVLYVFLSGCILLANSMPSPQTQEVSIDDILEAAGVEVPTTYEEFEHVSNKVEDGTYDYNIIEYQKFSVKNYKKWLSTLDKSKRF